jgi:hypothetical protein
VIERKGAALLLQQRVIERKAWTPFAWGCAIERELFAVLRKVPATKRWADTHFVREPASALQVSFPERKVSARELHSRVIELQSWLIALQS